MAIGAGLLVLAYGLVCWMIGSGVDDALSRASRQFPGRGSDAILAMVNSEEFPLKERNRAVWALGQLGDSRTVPSLEALLTGKPCDHAAGVCQYELKKAIRQCRGGTQRHSLGLEEVRSLVSPGFFTIYPENSVRVS